MCRGRRAGYCSKGVGAVARETFHGQSPGLFGTGREGRGRAARRQCPRRHQEKGELSCDPASYHIAGLRGNGRMKGKDAFWVILLLAIAGGLAYWWLQQDDRQEPPPVEPAIRETVEPAASGPRFPVPVAPLDDKPNVQPLPDLNASDDYLRIEIGQVFSPDIAVLLVNQALIERIVATIDNLPRPQIAERIRPVKPLDTDFAAIGQDDSGEFLLGRDNYERYDALVTQLQSVDIAQMVELYRRYYPLFQKAYEGLGYPNAYFNDRLVEVLDHLLATPEPGTEITLIRPNVLYEYADENLAALSSGQKLLIRMGPENREKILAVIRVFRERVAFAD